MPEILQVISEKDERDAWLEERKNSIGASEVYYCIHNPWSAWAWKLGIADRYVAATDDAAEIGRDSEAMHCRQYERKTGRRSRMSAWLTRRDDYPWLHGTLDATVTREDMEIGPLQFKAPGVFWNLDKLETLNFTPWWCQVQIEAFVTCSSFGVLSVLAGNFGGFEIRHFDFQIDLPWIHDVAIPAAEDVWLRVKSARSCSGQEDPFDFAPEETNDKDLEALKAGMPLVRHESMVDMPPEFEELHEALVMLKVEQKDVNHKRGTIEAQIRRTIGEHAGGRLPSGVWYSLKLEGNNKKRTLRSHG